MALAATLLAASGCLESAHPSPAPDPPAAASGGCRSPDSLVEDSAFHGTNAYGHVLRLACDLESDPPVVLARVPGTTERDAAAAYLASTLRSYGWIVRFQNFTGNEYEALPKGSVAAYAAPPYCSAPDLARMRGLSFSNVEARRGPEGPFVLLMAHYDSKRYASSDPAPENQTLPVPGANDGASGVSVLLEFARVLGSETLGREVRILLVDGEDGFQDCHPDAGSLTYAHALGEAERGQAEGVLLLDMVGDPAARFCMAGRDAELASRLRAAASEFDVPSIADAPPCSVLDDHTPFEDLGVSAIDLIDYDRPGFPPYWHTREDTPDKVSPFMLRDVGRVVLDVVRTLAG